MLDEAHIRSLVGLDVVDTNGKSIGNVEFVFNDQDTGRPEWLGIISGTYSTIFIAAAIAILWQGRKPLKGQVAAPETRKPGRRRAS